MSHRIELRAIQYFLCLLLVGGVFPSSAQVQFPDHSIRLIVPLAPGGGGDIVARLIATRTQAVLEQPIVVENKPGGATVIGTDFVAKAAPDGYTLLMATSSHVINGNFVRLPFDPIKDFVGVTIIGTTPLVLTVNAAFPAQTFKEFLALAATKKDGLTYASSGLGSMPHLSGEMLARVGNLNLTHIPYKGGGPAEAGLLGAQVDMYFASPPSIVEQVKAKKLRALAMSGETRMSMFPDVPTIAETFEGFDAGSFYAILAPLGTPQAILNKLGVAIKRATDTPEAKEQLLRLGIAVTNHSSVDTMKYIDRQIQQWRKVVSVGNIKVD